MYKEKYFIGHVQRGVIEWLFLVGAQTWELRRVLTVIPMCRGGNRSFIIFFSGGDGLTTWGWREERAGGNKIF